MNRFGARLNERIKKIIICISRNPNNAFDGKKIVQCNITFIGDFAKLSLGKKFTLNRRNLEKKEKNTRRRFSCK